MGYLIWTAVNVSKHVVFTLQNIKAMSKIVLPSKIFFLISFDSQENYWFPVTLAPCLLKYTQKKSLQKFSIFAAGCSNNFLSCLFPLCYVLLYRKFCSGIQKPACKQLVFYNVLNCCFEGKRAHCEMYKILSSHVLWIVLLLCCT